MLASIEVGVRCCRVADVPASVIAGKAFVLMISSVSGYDTSLEMDDVPEEGGRWYELDASFGCLSEGPPKLEEALMYGMIRIAAASKADLNAADTGCVMDKKLEDPADARSLLVRLLDDTPVQAALLQK